MLSNGNNNGRMPEYPTVERKLNDIPRFHLRNVRLHSDGANPAVVHKETVQEFDACPCGRVVVQTVVIPAEGGSRVHDTRSGVQHLGSEISAVPSEVFKIIVLRIASERPFVRVGHGVCPIVVFCSQLWHLPYMHYMREKVPIVR